MNFVRRMSTRVPMIKFRQGGAPDHGAGHAGGPAAAAKVLFTFLSKNHFIF